MLLVFEFAVNIGVEFAVEFAVKRVPKCVVQRS